MHFNMAGFTLPEGFTDFDMFMFGSALLVAGKRIEHTGRRVCARIKGAVHSKCLFNKHKTIKVSAYENVNHRFRLFSHCKVV